MAERVEKKRRLAFTVEEKFKIVAEIQSGKKQSDLCRIHNLPKSTVGTIWQNRQSIIKAFEEQNRRCKRMKKSAHDEVDQALLKWFIQNNNSGVTINGPILQAKAEEFGRELEGDENFKCSLAWIDRFKRRHDICTSKINAECGDVKKETVENWLENKWPEITRGYTENDIFHAHETALFFKLMPEKTFKFKNEKCFCGEFSKERLTVLVSTNLNGTEKRKLLVVGKYSKLRCFKNINSSPVIYAANSKAWMTSSIFAEHLSAWNQELECGKRKILLLLKNCKAHAPVELKNIKLQFLPANLTLQPMEHGIIRSLKSHYRHFFLSEIVHAMDTETDFSVNVLSAVNLLHKAWQCVTANTIKNCFKRAKLSKSVRFLDDFKEDYNLPLSYLLPTNCAQADFESYVGVDDGVITTEDLTGENETLNIKEEVDSDREENSHSNNNEPTATITLQQARGKVNELVHFLQTCDVSQDTLNACVAVQTCIEQMTWTTISSNVQENINGYCSTLS